MKIIASLLVAICLSSTAFATNNHPTTTTTLPPRAECQVEVDANPKAYCDSYAKSKAEASAKAICGDATANCNGGTAFSLAVTKQACVNASVQTNVTDVTCEAAALACGDTTATCALSCPPPVQCPDVEIGTRVLRCKRVITRPSGKVIRKGCLVVTEAY